MPKRARPWKAILMLKQATESRLLKGDRLSGGCSNISQIMVDVFQQAAARPPNIVCLAISFWLGLEIGAADDVAVLPLVNMSGGWSSTQSRSPAARPPQRWAAGRIKAGAARAPFPNGSAGHWKAFAIRVEAGHAQAVRHQMRRFCAIGGCLRSICGRYFRLAGGRAPRRARSPSSSRK
jgi:hypothetical protein